MKFFNIIRIYLALLASVSLQANVLHFAPVKDGQDFALHSNFLQTIRSVFKKNFFVESGTFLGKSSRKASLIFDQVHTIELSKELYDKATLALSDRKNIFTYSGDSATVLKTFTADLLANSFLWLDAHYSGNMEGFNTAKGHDNTPITRELKAIEALGVTSAVVAIDDIRCFDVLKNVAPHSIFEGYPTLNALCDQLLAINPQYQFVVLPDVIIAYTDKNVAVSPVAQACTKSRLYTEGSMSKAEIIANEKIIAQAQGVEKQSIENIHHYGFDAHGLKYGMGQHYILWQALILYQNKQYEYSLKLLNYLKRNNLLDWRVDWYLAKSLSKTGKKDDSIACLQSMFDFDPSFEKVELKLKKHSNN